MFWHCIINFCSKMLRCGSGPESRINNFCGSDFIETENSGVFKAFSNEWFVDQIQEYIEYEAETPENRALFQKILDTNPHRHALEIYRVVKDFSRKYLM